MSHKVQLTPSNYREKYKKTKAPTKAHDSPAPPHSPHANLSDDSPSSNDATSYSHPREANSEIEDEVQEDEDNNEDDNNNDDDDYYDDYNNDDDSDDDDDDDGEDDEGPDEDDQLNDADELEEGEVNEEPITVNVDLNQEDLGGSFQYKNSQVHYCSWNPVGYDVSFIPTPVLSFQTFTVP